MFEQFSITALQLIKLFSFIAAGYLLRRLSLLPDQTGIVLSKLEVYLFLPALCFRTMANNFRPSVIKEQSTMLACPCFYRGQKYTGSLFLFIYDPKPGLSGLSACPGSFW